MSDLNRKNGAKTDGRKGDGTFAKGNPGKPKGARHATTKAVEALLEGQAETLTQAAMRVVQNRSRKIRVCGIA